MKYQILETRTTETGGVYTKYEISDGVYLAHATICESDGRGSLSETALYKNDAPLYRINVYEIYGFLDDGNSVVGVNWPAMGTAPVSETDEFIEDLTFARNVAKTINDIIKG